MPTKIVNVYSGNVAEPFKPNSVFYFGCRHSTDPIDPTTITASTGLSSICHHGVLPPNDTSLEPLGVSVSLDTPERVRPLLDQNTIALSGTDIVSTRTSSNDGDLSIYEISVDLPLEQSVLGMVRLKKNNSWTYETRSWCDAANVTPVYLGLEVGNLNTGAFVFLRNNGGLGNIVVGGPQQEIGGVRPGQTEMVFDFLTMPDGDYMDIYIYFDMTTRLLEVWGYKEGDSTISVLTSPIPLAALDTFPLPTSGFSNFRSGTSTTATLYFGNAGSVGDVVTFSDWAIFPDFRRSVLSGQESSNNKVDIVPDSPIGFHAGDNKKPNEALLHRWSQNASGLSPVANLHYRPGRRDEAQYVTLTKTSSGLMAYEREEYRVSDRIEGVMIEAFMAGELTIKGGDSLGAGLIVEDGEKAFRVVMLDDQVTRTYGLSKDNANTTSYDLGYHLPSDVEGTDYTSLKLVRLNIDRARDKVELYVDGERKISKSLSDEFPASSSSLAKIGFGHIQNSDAQSIFKLAFLNYVLRYLSWRAEDGVKPNDASLNSLILFTETVSGIGSSSISSSVLTITKPDFNVSGSKILYSKEAPFRSIGGSFVEFRARVKHYIDSAGRQSPTLVKVGAGLNIYLGGQVLEFGFYDCGTHGKKIGILPKNGTVDDILNQTELGKKYSASFDWTEFETYRISIKAGYGLQVWAGTVINDPILEIAWNGGFGLPDSFATPSLEFGHFDPTTSSITEWEFVTWGVGDGYDVSIQRSYPNGYERYLFGGKVLLLTSFSE